MGRFVAIVTPAVLLLMLGIVVARHGGPLPGDAALARELAPFAGRGAAALSRAASLPVWSAVVLIGAAALWLASRPRAALLLIGTDVAAELVAFVLKELVARPRPPAGALLGADSFPSSSVVRVGIALGVLGLMLTWPRPTWRLPAAVGVALALLIVGAARVAVGAHWPSDVLGAGLLVAIGLQLAWRLVSQTPGAVNPSPTAARRRRLR
jgi:undecaprenyl-diphosphatase